MMEMPPLPPLPGFTFAGEADARLITYAREYGELCARMAREEAARIADGMDTMLSNQYDESLLLMRCVCGDVAAAIRKG